MFCVLYVMLIVNTTLWWIYGALCSGGCSFNGVVCCVIDRHQECVYQDSTDKELDPYTYSTYMCNN